MSRPKTPKKSDKLTVSEESGGSDKSPTRPGSAHRSPTTESRLLAPEEAAAAGAQFYGTAHRSPTTESRSLLAPEEAAAAGAQFYGTSPSRSCRRRDQFPSLNEDEDENQGPEDGTAASTFEELDFSPKKPREDNSPAPGRGDGGPPVDSMADFKGYFEDRGVADASKIKGGPWLTDKDGNELCGECSNPKRNCKPPCSCADRCCKCFVGNFMHAVGDRIHAVKDTIFGGGEAAAHPAPARPATAVEAVAAEGMLTRDDDRTPPPFRRARHVSAPQPRPSENMDAEESSENTQMQDAEENLPQFPQ